MGPDVPKLLSHQRRRSIACAALDAPVTIGQIARALDVPDGSIRSMVERLARDQLLVSTQRPSKAKTVVTAYQVAPAHTTVVRRICATVEEPSLEAEAEIILVPLAGLPAASSVLARQQPAVVAWAVRTRDPQLSLMIGLRRDTPPEERDALALDLRDAGADCVRVFVGESFTPSALFAYAAGLVSRRQAALPEEA